MLSIGVYVNVNVFTIYNKDTISDTIIDTVSDDKKWGLVSSNT